MLLTKQVLNLRKEIEFLNFYLTLYNLGNMLKIKNLFIVFCIFFYFKIPIIE